MIPVLILVSCHLKFHPHFSNSVPIMSSYQYLVNKKQFGFFISPVVSFHLIDIFNTSLKLNNGVNIFWETENITTELIFFENNENW